MAPKTSSETFRYFKRFSALERTESAQSVAFRIGDEITFEGRKLNDLSKEVDMTTNSFTNLDQQGRLTFGYAISRQLGHASTSDAGAVNLCWAMAACRITSARSSWAKC